MVDQRNLRYWRLEVAEASRMSEMQQLVLLLTPYFQAAGYVVLAVYVCAAFYAYLAAAAAAKSIFHTRVRTTVPLAVLFIVPRDVLRQYNVPEAIALGLETLSTLAMLAIVVLGLRMMIAFLSQLFTRALLPPSSQATSSQATSSQATSSQATSSQATSTPPAD
jgi:hypothetical protein